MNQIESKPNGKGRVSEQSFWDGFKGEFGYWRFACVFFADPDEPVEWPKSDE